MADQLALPIGPAHDRLCGVLPIRPAVAGEDGSLESVWIRSGRLAWRVWPVPSGCPAYEGGMRWFHDARPSAPPASVGSGGSSGSRETKAEAIETTLRDLQHREERYRKLKHRAEQRRASR